MTITTLLCKGTWGHKGGRCLSHIAEQIGGGSGLDPRAEGRAPLYHASPGGAL